MTDYNNLIRRLRIYDCFSREAADALAALVKERDDCIADRTKLRTLLDCKREDTEWMIARLHRLEDALRGVRDHEPEHCGCGFDGCMDVVEAWDAVRAALAEGDKP